jgi:tRNA nucleotidyltransferase (CCA-adding enzyme)
VRDLLLGRVPRECDIVVAGDAATLARELGAVVAEHDRFGTYEVDADGLPCDIATARSERYRSPGALPDVEPAGLDSDLLRRDFTINALMLSPAGGVTGAPHALEDLTGKRLRVLHPNSFVDDPTRLWRLVRYAVRLGFLPDDTTDAAAHDAVAAGALATVSGERLAAELRLALAEPDPLAVLHAAQHLGLVEGLTIDPAVAARAVELVDGYGSRELALLGSCVPAPGWGSGFALRPDERNGLDRCAGLAPLPEVPPGLISELASSLAHEPVEAVAVAGARGSAATAYHFITDWRDRTLSITGDDLLAAGLVSGPEMGHLLAATRAALLDGKITAGRESELAFALGATDGTHEG